MKNEIEKIIKTAMDNGFKFGSFYKNSHGLKFYDFEVNKFDINVGHEIKLTYKKKQLVWYVYFDFAALLFNKNFMTNLFKKVALRVTNNHRFLRPTIKNNQEVKIATYRLAMQVYNDIFNSGINAGIKTILSIIERGE